MKTITFGLFILSLTTLISCNPADQEEKSELRYFKVEAKDFDNYVNQKSMPLNPNLKADKTILNRDYPIEIALYNDGRWFYDLPNLDTGTGTWKIENGMIKLFAEQRLFDMYIDIQAIKENAEDVVIKFRDRFGQRILNVEKTNINL